MSEPKWDDLPRARPSRDVFVMQLVVVSSAHVPRAEYERLRDSYKAGVFPPTAPYIIGMMFPGDSDELLIKADDDDEVYVIYPATSALLERCRQKGYYGIRISGDCGAEFSDLPNYAETWGS